ncbi:uncharacterized protein LOC128127143 [Lactuca sativa]|uniref:uncharacterized protein LOC128127143 n=1 Tax=Lactuca sativa TaxID=4236 RepID=UPI0022B04970|nr:uncharacterized protein LOC128127143 [Lactuca sativa]
MKFEVERDVREDERKETSKSKRPIDTEVKVTPAPFPSRLTRTKREWEDDEIMAMFRKVEINIPLLDAITQIPRYAKFQLCTSKKKLKGNQTMKVGENVSSVLQKRLPKKCKDLGVFMVPCKIGVGPLTKIRVIIQLVDHSLVHPKGVLEDVLVQVNELVFAADFYVFDMGDDDQTSSSILLGRPFLKTAKTKNDFYNGTLSMEFDGEVINFNIYEAMRYLSDVHSINFLDMIQPLTEKCFELTSHDFLELVLSNNFDNNLVKEITTNFKPYEELLEFMEFMEERKEMRYDNSKVKLLISNTKLLPSIVQAPKLELKCLPDHLKYAYLGEDKTLPIIISDKLSIEEEDKLVTLLKKYKKAIGWTIVDIKGCMPFGLSNAPAIFQRCMVSIFSEYVENIIEVLMDDFTIYGNSFDECLSNLTKILQRCIDTDFVLNYEKCHSMVDKGLILGHIVSQKGLEVEKTKIDVIKSLPYPTNVREVCSFLGHAGSYRRFIKDFSKIMVPMCQLLQKYVKFEFT